MKTLHGLSASRGIAIGTAYQYKKDQLRIDNYTVTEISVENQRLSAAMEQARQEIALVINKARMVAGNETAAIFAAQAVMLEDPEYLATIRGKFTDDALNAEAAVADATETYARMLEGMEEETFRTRAADIRDVGMRLIRILSGKADPPVIGPAQPAIILATELTPSDTISLDKSLVLGFCTVGGGQSSHVAILARELGLPAVVCMGDAITSIPDGCHLILDGGEGSLLVEPDAESTAQARQKAVNRGIEMIDSSTLSKQLAFTRDGQRIQVMANIGNVESARNALESGADGVGLFRTEFLYLGRDNLPHEEEQYLAYREILDVFGSLPVSLRTLDIGGDKESLCLSLPKETNPFLGFRGIRLCLARPEIFKPQLKAALRASVDRNLKVMFPMIATVGEVRAARNQLEECRRELAAQGIDVKSKVEVGVMIEIPAAAIMADLLAEEVDFFSIGTNDLSQYTMAADRTSSSVSALADAFQPAVLCLVRDVVQSAHRRGKRVGMCGELAGEPLAIPLLLGLGLDELSMNPRAIPFTKQIVRSVAIEESVQVAKEALRMESPNEIRDWLITKVPSSG